MARRVGRKQVKGGDPGVVNPRVWNMLKEVRA